MQHAEIDRGKAAAFQKRDRQRIAQRQQHQRGGGGGKVVRAGLAGLRQRQRDIGGLAQGGGAVRRHRDQRNAEARGVGDQRLHLGLLAGPRQRHDDVVGGDHAEVAMAGLGGVDEEGGRAGGGEGGGDLARHMAGLAEPGDDQPAPGVANGVGGGSKRRAESGLRGGGQGGNGAAIGLKG